MRYSMILLMLAVSSLALSEANGQSLSAGRFQLGAAIGTRGMSTEQVNFLNESVTRFDRSLNLVYAQLAFRQSDRLSFWFRYAAGYNPDAYVLGGMDRQQTSFFVGGRQQAGAYTLQLEYAYNIYQDSLYQDALMVEQAYELAGGLKPTLKSWIGIGKQALIEWMIQAGVVIPVNQQIGLEPLIIGTRTLLYPDASTMLGLRAHIGLFEKGSLKAAISRELNAPEEARTAFYITGAIPFMQWHQLNVTLQRNVLYPGRTTLFALGMTLGIGRAG